MDLVARCLDNQWTRIAFIGATKHAGKTTALNSFVHQAEERQIPVGLCSIGLDGERLDSILGVEKPAVYVPYGSIVISAERALEQSTAGLEWLETLPIDSPLGSVAICRVTMPGTVLLAGVRQRAHVELAVPTLKAHGAQFQLVDGAFDRIAAASPNLVDTAILAVGAVAGKTVEQVAQHAQPFLQRFQIPEADDGWKGQFAPVHKECATGWWDGKTLHITHQSSMVHGVTSQTEWSADVEAVYIPGALTDSVVQSLIAHSQSLTIICSHPAQLLLGADTYRKLYRAGHQLCVWNQLPVLAIAVNPHSITGYDLPRQNLFEAIAAIAGDIPLYDAMAVHANE